MADQNENRWDRLLRIRTTGRDDSKADQYHYPYEPTPYSVLERLANSGLISKKNTMVDYGCGKGRVEFYLSSQAGCSSIGVEYDPRIFQAAVHNQKTAVSRAKTKFLLQAAETYMPPENADRFYFFNPFSIQLFQKVLGRLKESYYENPREMLLIFYYPSDEYKNFLINAQELEFHREIGCRDLFDEEDPREILLVYRLDL